MSNFNPRHPYGWRLKREKEGLHANDISIHATHTGGDLIRTRLAFSSLAFQSTPPIRVATHTETAHHETDCISIHATHTGGDSRLQHDPQRYLYFNPRHPYGWRHQFFPDCVVASNISIHATHTGGDFRNVKFLRRHNISIHATHTGGDDHLPFLFILTNNFNPRHPYGWRPGCRSGHGPG